MFWLVVPVLLMLVSNVVGTIDEPPFPPGMVVVTPTSPDPLDPEFKVGEVGVTGSLFRSVMLGMPVRRPVGGTDTSGGLAEVVVNEPPSVPVDDVLGTPVLLTGLVPDAIVPCVKVM